MSELSELNFFGPQEFIILHPPDLIQIKCIRYGYESKGKIYDVVIPERSVKIKKDEFVSKWYLTNGIPTLTPDKIHLTIERKFNL